MTGAPVAVVALWWITLILTVIFIVPLTIRLLHRTFAAARTTRRYAADTRAAADGIVANVAGTAALDSTIAAAGPLLQRTAGPASQSAGPGAQVS